MPKSTYSSKKKAPKTSMSVVLRRIVIQTAVWLLSEAVLLATLSLLYFFDIPTGFKAAMVDWYWLFIAIAITVINMVFLLIAEVRIFRIRRRSDIEAATVVGSDIQEAYNFGQLGLVVTDDNDMVLWTNNLFKERQVDLLDQNILEWQPALAELKNAPAEMTQKLEINSHNYVVKFLADARLYIFKDTTDYESVSEYHRQQAICIGVIIFAAGAES